jgi:ubiquinone/menaquinone biosynthesis C-methylase UbiE
VLLTRDDVPLLACPVCRNGVRFEGRLREDALDDGDLRCLECGRRWPVRNGLAFVYEEGAVQGLDRLLRPIYDFIAPVHDLSVNTVLPVLQFPDAGTRHHYINRMELDRLRGNDRPRRILEIGIGGGANVPYIEQALAPGLNVELWGLDLSRGMLGQCRRRLAWERPEHRIRLFLADAHALPFPDGVFDRVLHVGAINGYRDRRRALAEMARVARRGTPIVVVDEQLDETRHNTLYHRLGFRALTWYDPDPHAPRKELPPGAAGVEVTAVSRFYYCLRFMMPAPREEARVG